MLRLKASFFFLGSLPPASQCIGLEDLSLSQQFPPATQQPSPPPPLPPLPLPFPAPSGCILVMAERASLTPSLLYTCNMLLQLLILGEAMLHVVGPCTVLEMFTAMS